MSDLPLVSAVLITYNQAPYIAEAVKALFAQDYPNLEVILSDDRSTDDTFRIIESLARDYSGPHKIRLNRNDVNRGIGHHVNVSHALAAGELVVCADGDDVSLPHRVSRLVKAWRESHQLPSLLCSNALKISAAGEPLGLLQPAERRGYHDRPANPMRGNLPTLGCTIAYTREVRDRFGKMAERLMAADTVWYRRAYLLGGAQYVPEVLVKYRLGSGGVSQVQTRSREAYLRMEQRWIPDRLLRFEQMRADTARLAPPNQREILDETDAQERHERRKLEMLSGALLKSSKALAMEYLDGSRRWADYREMVRAFVIRWLPSLIRYQP